jgi:hypothetical protein
MVKLEGRPKKLTDPLFSASTPDAVPGDKTLHETSFPGHKPAQDRDYVFTCYAP